MRKHLTPPTHRLALAGVIASLLCGNVLADTDRYAINGDTQSSTRSHAKLNVLLAGLQPIPNTSIYVWATGSQLGEFCLLAKDSTKGQQAWVPAITHTSNGTILNGQAHCPDASAKLINPQDKRYWETITASQGSIPAGTLMPTYYIGASKQVWPSPDREIFVPILYDIDLSAPLFDDVKVYVGVVDETGQQKTEYAEIYAVNATPIPTAPIDNAFGEAVTLKTGISSEPCSVNFGDHSNQGKTQRYALCPEAVEHVYQKPDRYTVKIGRSSGMLKEQVVEVNTDSWFAYVGTFDGEKFPNSKADFIQNGILNFKPTFPVNLPPYSAENPPNGNIFYTTYGLKKNLPTNSDAFSLEMRMKNIVVPDSQQCSHISTRINGENDKLIWVSFQPTCEVSSDGEFSPLGSYNYIFYDTPKKTIINRVSIMLANTNIGVTERDFANDFTDWRTVKIKVANKNIRVFYDGVEVLSAPYQYDLGQIKGITQDFNASGANVTGSGSIDWVKVYDANDKVVYQEDFN